METAVLTAVRLVGMAVFIAIARALVKLLDS